MNATLTKVELHPEVIKFLESQDMIQQGDFRWYGVTRAIHSDPEGFYLTDIDYAELRDKMFPPIPPIYVTTEEAPLWDAFSCKTGKDKIVLTTVPKGTTFQLYDCDPEYVNQELVGCKVMIQDLHVGNGMSEPTGYRQYTGYIDKTKITKYEEGLDKDREPSEVS